MTRFLILSFFSIAIAGACALPPAGNSAVKTLPAMNATSPIPTSDESKNDPEQLARFLIGLDDGGKAMADINDIRVKRVRYLLWELANVTGEKTFDISAATDGAASNLESKYGKRVARQTLLEEMKGFYSDPQIRKAKPDYKDALTAHVILDYAK